MFLDTNISLETTNYNVLNSGCVIVPNGEEIQFNIDNLQFRFTFIEELDENGSPKKSYLKLKEHDGKSLCISLINMNDSTNAVNTNMINIGNIKGMDLFLKFCITSINQQESGCDFFMAYTWYLKKK